MSGTNVSIDVIPLAAATSATQKPATAVHRVDWARAAAVCYAIGLLIVAGVRILRYRQFARAVHSMPLAELETRGAVAAICRKNDLQRVPTVRISAAAPAPYIVSAWDPQLVLSPRQLARPEELIGHLRQFGSCRQDQLESRIA